MNIAAFKVRHSVGIDIDATALRAARSRSSSIGAMEEMSGKVQNANTHPLQCQSREHAHSSRSVQGPQFKGAMEEMSGKVQNASTHRLRRTRTTAGQFKGQFKGAMDDSSRNVQNANAHLTLCKQGSIQSVQWGDGGNV